MKSVLLYLIAFVLLSCSASKTTLDHASSGSPALPTDFSPGNGTLLIESSDGKDSYSEHFLSKNQKEMIEYAKDKYKFKHEFASLDEIYGEKSRFDKTTHRFALVTAVTTASQFSKTAADGTVRTTVLQPIFRYYLYDRQQDKTYAALSKGSSLIMWAYKAAIKTVAEVK